MKNVFIAFMSLALVATISSCKKENDLTTDIVGTYYYEDTECNEITISKVDDKTILVDGMTAEMTSKTKFTVSETTTNEYIGEDEDGVSHNYKTTIKVAGVLAGGTTLSVSYNWTGYEDGVAIESTSDYYTATKGSCP